MNRLVHRFVRVAHSTAGTDVASCALVRARLEDLLIGTVAVIVTAPLMLAIAVGVKLSSPGPVLFRQHRYGLSGKAVEVWKFRSMTVQVCAAGGVLAGRALRFLRR